MRFFRAFAVGVITAVAGMFLAIFASDYLTRLYHVPDMEGQRGMTVIFLAIFYFIAAVLGLSGFIIVSSMMADVVEDAAVSTGQRSEGLLFAANGLIAKCVTGVGTFLSALILAWVSFPQHATPGQVDPAILHRLGMVFVPMITVFSDGTVVRAVSPWRLRKPS